MLRDLLWLPCMQSLTKHVNRQDMARAMSSLVIGKAPKLTRDSLNKRTVKVEYAVRGKIVLASLELEVGVRNVLGLVLVFYG